MNFFCDSTFWKKINKPQKVANIGMESKFKFKWSCKMNMVFFNSLIIVLFYFTFSINYIYFVKYCDCIFHESCISLILCTIKLFSRLIWWILLTFLFLFLLQRYLVHRLNPNCTSKNPNLTIMFFHGIAYGISCEIYNEWKETWTTRPINHKEKCICRPQMWIPKDLNDNVIILSLSYDYNVVASVHNDMTKIGQNLIQRVIDSRSNNILICGHLFFHCVFQLKIIDCILTSLNKLFMRGIIVFHTKSWTFWSFQIHWKEHEIRLLC